jgi:hypothetical protein
MKVPIKEIIKIVAFDSKFKHKLQVLIYHAVSGFLALLSVTQNFKEMSQNSTTLALEISRSKYCVTCRNF